MLVITKKYDNGVERNLTVTSAQYCNAEHNAIIIITEESGAVLISQASSPNEWNQLISNNNIEIADYQIPQQPQEEESK